MIIYNINPVLLNIGPIQIRYYSLAYIFGIIVSYLILRKFVKEQRIKNLDLKGLDDLMFYMVLGLILGARIFYFAFYDFASFRANPLEFFMIWHGGMSFHGAFLGVVLVLFWFSKKKGLSFYELADLLVIPAALALFLGRIMNFINGELIGTKTNLPFCIQYPNVEGCRHPSQIYEAIKNLFIFFVLLYLYTKKKLAQGLIFWYFVFLYGSLRFLVDFFRDDPRFLGISTGQYLSLAMALISIYFIYKIKKKTKYLNDAE
jgi:phosphatidylglycerol:prolipoprotein diacylglycerol transferase